MAHKGIRMISAADYEAADHNDGFVVEVNGTPTYFRGHEARKRAETFADRSRAKMNAWARKRRRGYRGR